jgi:hypothetical protein
MSKFKVGNPWKTGKTNSERKGIGARGRRALKRRDNGVPNRNSKLYYTKELKKISPVTQETPERIIYRTLYF